MAPEEKEKILYRWNETHVSYPSDICIHELFEKQASRNPSRLAVEFEGGSCTYEELNRRANRLANYLIRLGAGPQILVGVCLDRSIEMVVTLLAILKSGAGYLPIEPNFPADRQMYMLSDSEADLLISRRSILPISKTYSHVDSIKLICLDRDSSEIYRLSSENPESRVLTTNLAYLIYTSGSTGKPKGAINNHDGIYNRLLWMQDAHPLKEGDRVLQKTPFSFDVSVWEFFWPLMFGARLILARPGGERDPDYLIALIQKFRISTLHFVPSMLHIFLSTEGVEKCESLRQVFCSGEALSVDVMNRFFKVFKCSLYNLYGPTEAAIDVSSWSCRADETLRSVPIGFPVSNTQLHILNENMEPVSAETAGELHIGGVQVGKGYHNRQVLTEERFVSNPFGHGKLYKTGDKARYLLDGSIEFLGRLDDQIKIGGFRIEPAEIESALLQSTVVEEAAVVAHIQSSGHQRLVAYVTIRDEVTNRSDLICELGALLRSQLPDLMVPGVIVVLDNFPLTANGKVDRHALPDPNLRRYCRKFPANREGEGSGGNLVRDS